MPAPFSSSSATFTTSDDGGTNNKVTVTFTGHGYKTGDQVRFASDEDTLSVQIDLPGVTKEDLDLSTDTDQREVYIKAKRKVKAHDGEKEQTYNRSFSVGREFDLNKINFSYVNGVLEVDVPRRKKEEYIKTYKV